MTNPDGSSYEGEFKNGKMEGTGTKVYANGNTYTGTFKNNLEHGKGTVFNRKNQTETIKEFREGKPWTLSTKDG